MKRALPWAVFVSVCALALAFDLTLRLRLPSDADWAEAAAALRAHGQPGDAVQLWPPWAERGRLFVDALPVFAEEDLAAADYAGVRRLWLLSLPRVPFARLDAARAALLRRGASAEETLSFGALRLERFDLRAPAVATFVTSRGEAHEVDYVARECERVPIGARLQRRAEGRTLHVRAGLIGERAYDAGRPAVLIRVAGVTLEVNGPGWKRLEVPLAAPAVELATDSADPSPPFCIEAWTTR